VLDSPYFFEGVTYWSPGDERAHFDWLERISVIRSVRGQGRRVYLDIDIARATADEVQELEAVYRRYDGDVAQLDEMKARVNAQN
jgi:hypothetical protein